MKGAEITKLLEDVIKPISAIEKQIGIPPTVLQKAMKGKRPLPKRWAILLKDYVKRKLYLVKGDIPPPTQKETGQNPTQTEKTEKDAQKEEPPKNEGNKPECPDPKKDRAGWAKWMREFNK